MNSNEPSLCVYLRESKRKTARGKEGFVGKEEEGWGGSLSENRASLAALMQQREAQWWLTSDTVALILYAVYIIDFAPCHTTRRGAPTTPRWRHSIKTFSKLHLFSGCVSLYSSSFSFSNHPPLSPSPPVDVRRGVLVEEMDVGGESCDWVRLREGQRHLLSSAQIHEAKQQSPSASDGL